jgi:hypothetical protein
MRKATTLPSAEVGSGIGGKGLEIKKYESQL